MSLCQRTRQRRRAGLSDRQCGDHPGRTAAEERAIRHRPARDLILLLQRLVRFRGVAGILQDDPDLPHFQIRVILDRQQDELRDLELLAPPMAALH